MYTGPEVLDRQLTPRGEIQLQRRGEHYEVISNGVFLMATYNGESERLLVTAALAAVPEPQRVLIGGLGVGFSLAAALADQRVRSATVVEIEAPLIGWNRTYLAPFSHHGLDDPRTHLVHDDLLHWLAVATEQYEAICLDIDNGPDWTVTEANRSLYTEEGLALVARRLAPAGVAAYWSAAAAPAFARRMASHFGEVQALTVPQEHGDPDYVYLGLARRS